MASEAGKGSKPRKITKESRESYEDNYDRIWGSKKKPITHDEDWDEIRMDIIGINGNQGLHYDQDPDPNDM